VCKNLEEKVERKMKEKVLKNERKNCAKLLLKKNQMKTEI
jgi:hypothetical protein